MISKLFRFLLFMLVLAESNSLLDYDGYNSTQLVPLLRKEYFCDNFLISRFILENQSLNSLVKYLKHAIGIIRTELKQKCKIFSGTLKEEMVYCPESKLYTGCLEATHLGTGVHRLSDNSKMTTNSYLAFCLADNEGGPPWTIIQRRVGDDISFQRNFEEYEKGFGNPFGSYWLGLNRLYALIASGWQHELWILLQNFKNETRFIKFDDFAIGDANRQYALISLGKAEGTAGNALAEAIGAKFSTIDRSSDEADGTVCALTSSGGGWWFRGDLCGQSNLNGVYYQNGKVTEERSGILWETWLNAHKSYKYVHIAVRRKK